MTEGQGWLLGTEMEDCYMRAGTTQFAGVPEGPCSLGSRVDQRVSVLFVQRRKL